MWIGLFRKKKLFYRTRFLKLKLIKLNILTTKQ